MKEGSLLVSHFKKSLDSYLEKKGFTRSLEYITEESIRNALNTLKSLRVLIYRVEDPEIQKGVARLIGDLYERIVNRIKKTSFNHLLEIKLMPRVGKVKVINPGDVEDREILRRLILDHFISGKNLFIHRDDINHQEGEAPLFEDEEKSQSRLREILSQIAFRYYFDWCGKELGFGKDFIKNLERISSMTNLELVELKKMVREILLCSLSSRFEADARRILWVIENVLESRIRGSRREREPDIPAKFYARYPEVFFGEDRGFTHILFSCDNEKKSNPASFLALEYAVREGGSLIARLPVTFAISEEWAEARSRLKKSLKELSQEGEFLTCTFEPGKTYKSSDPDPIMISVPPKEEALIKSISSRFPIRLRDLCTIEPGLRIRRLVSENATYGAVFPENLLPYRIGGSIRRVDLSSLKESAQERAFNLARPKVVVVRKADFSTLPIPHIKVTASPDLEGLIPSDGLISILPEQSDLPQDLVIFTLTAFMNSILFGWLLHRTGFALINKEINLTPYSLGVVPLSDDLLESVRIGELARKLYEEKFNGEVFLALEEEILICYGLSPENMPLSYRKLLAQPEVVKI